MRASKIRATRALKQYREIVKALERGVPAEELKGAHYLGEGSDRAAYLVGPFVVKAKPMLFAGRSNERVESLYQKAKDYVPGLRLLPTRRVNGYEIQVYHEPLQETDSEWTSPMVQRLHLESELDLGCYNLAIDHRDRIVAFDW